MSGNLDRAHDAGLGPIVILGASGHAREILDLLRLLGLETGRMVDESNEAEIESRSRLVLGVGRPLSRLGAYRKFNANFDFLTLRHPDTGVAASAKIGRGTVISRGAVVSTDASVGAACLLNWNCTVGHDATIGAGSVLNPGSAVSGNCRLGEGVLVGAGAVVLEGVVIEDRAQIGAGAVVTSNVPAGVTVTGVPARLRIER